MDYQQTRSPRQRRFWINPSKIARAALIVGMVGTTLGLVRATKAEGVAKRRFEEAEVARAKAAASAVAEAEQRKKAEKAEADTLADYRASTDDAIEQLIGSKEELGPKERAYLENTLKRWQAFAARQGADERSQAIRGEGHSRVAMLWANLGRNEEARAEYQVARDIRKKLVEEFSAVSTYQHQLAENHINLGNQLAVIGKWEESRARSQIKAGMVAEAVAEVAELAKNPNSNAGQWYSFACFYSVASGRIADKQQEYADRAMELLTEAVEAGWRNAAHMANDTDLNPLRDRDDFRKLFDTLSEQEPKGP